MRNFRLRRSGAKLKTLGKGAALTAVMVSCGIGLIAFSISAWGLAVLMGFADDLTDTTPKGPGPGW